MEKEPVSDNGRAAVTDMQNISGKIDKQGRDTDIGIYPEEDEMANALWQICGCTRGHPSACTENYASGRGISNCARILLSLSNDPVLKNISSCLDWQGNFPDLSGLAADSRLRNHSRPDHKAS